MWPEDTPTSPQLHEDPVKDALPPNAMSIDNIKHHLLGKEIVDCQAGDTNRSFGVTMDDGTIIVLYVTNDEIFAEIYE